MQRKLKVIVVLFFLLSAATWLFVPVGTASAVPTASAQFSPTPPVYAFDQAGALAKLREQIKGREAEPAPAVFKNIQTLKEIPAGRLLSIMEMGFSRSLGVNCTHCHVPEKWESEDKPQKQITREMWGMVSTINRSLLKNIRNLKSETPNINCTTCHRGEIKPAQNMLR